MMKNGRMSLKRKFISAGVFKAELDEFLRRELAEDGYSGVKVRSNERHTEIIISATKTQAVLGEQSRRLRELTSLLQKRTRGNKTIELFVEKMLTRSLSATTQAESLRYKLTGGLPVRKACYSVLRFIMEAGAKGAEVIVSGKIKGQRAKSMKFSDGLMIHSGDPVNYYIDRAVRHVRLPQGILGIRVKIMLNHDPAGRTGPRKALPDYVHILAPKEEAKVEAPQCIPRNPAAKMNK
nr:ribosomal protein S3 [Hymenolepis microstoma]